MKIWLFIGVVMVFVQVILGGITRLTGSGLSITKWEIVTGTLPPMNEDEWGHEFDLYKETPQYQKINTGMSMRAFKVIYFWEYFHRLWARSIGFVFLIPFIIFWLRKKIDKQLMLKLGRVVGLGLIVAVFGWIMVASGLNERPWVNAYKLTLHLNLALVLFVYLLWTFLFAMDPDRRVLRNSKTKHWLIAIAWILGIQLVLGGVMSGMKAGLYYPTWPDMNGEMIPGVLLNTEQWSLESFKAYDTRPLAPAVFQFLHRIVAYALTIVVVIFFFRSRKLSAPLFIQNANLFLLAALLLQVVLGIVTVINCVGLIPPVWGVLHQAGAIVLLSAVVLLHFRTSSE